VDKSAKLLVNRIKGALSEHGAVSDFCKKTGISRTAVNSWLDGKTVPSLGNLDAIADYFRVSAQELVSSEKPLSATLPQDWRKEAASVVKKVAILVDQLPPPVLAHLLTIDWKRVDDQTLFNITDALRAVLAVLPKKKYRADASESPEEESG
jgi:transcriptional regulator with XRE-family HTH domain